MPDRLKQNDAATLGRVERVLACLVGGGLILNVVTRPSPLNLILAFAGAALIHHGLAGTGLPSVADPTPPDAVDLAGEESFPASDPPSFSPLTVGAA